MKIRDLTFANKITICRILVVPFFILTIFFYSVEKEYLRFLILAMFAFAVISDAVDGYVARVYRQKTKAGAILDPLADKFLLISAFSCLYLRGNSFGDIYFPLWFIIPVISRDVILLIGSFIIYSIHGELDIVPTICGKATAFLQMVSVLGILLQWRSSPFIWKAALVFTLISAVQYIGNGINLINREINKH